MNKIQKAFEEHEERHRGLEQIQKIVTNLALISPVGRAVRSGTIGLYLLRYPLQLQR